MANCPFYSHQVPFPCFADASCELYDADTGRCILRTACAPIASGSYAGNDTVNRAIAHGLGVTPKQVLIIESTGKMWHRITDQAGKIYYLSTRGEGNHDVTAISATNFYVGNATDYARSANASGETYYWAAIG